MNRDICLNQLKIFLQFELFVKLLIFSVSISVRVTLPVEKIHAREILEAHLRYLRMKGA